jgi:hypothetical protein
MKMAKIIAGVFLAAAGLYAQETGGFLVGPGRIGRGGAMIEQFQQPGTMTAVEGALIKSSALSGQTVTGRPVSGTEVRKSTQTLGDGTEIATSESDLFYRDSAGRTRLEMTAQGRIVLVDPVARVTVTLNTAAKTARKVTMPVSAEASRVAVAVAGPEAGRGSPTYVFTLGNGAPALAAAGRRGAGSAENRKHEDLGVESLNGVLATHTRDTLTIPQGQIGNNRDIHVVNERWYSDDLQMLVKTANSDPRFGENTYEFTDISRDEPDATLFQIPPDYTMLEMGRGAPTLPPPAINN